MFEEYSSAGLIGKWAAVLGSSFCTIPIPNTKYKEMDMYGVLCFGDNVRGDNEPRVFFEFGMPSTARENTEPQLFSYVSNTSGEIDEDR